MDNHQILEQIAQSAKLRGIDPGAMTMAEVTIASGLSRSSLYRRFGSRGGLLRALAAAGYEPGEHLSAGDAALRAAHAIIKEQGIPYLTLEKVAERADVSVPSVYATFRTRSGLMSAVFARYSPLPRISAALPQVLPTTQDGFRDLIYRIYGVLWDFLENEQAMVLAVIMEVLRDPDGDVMQWVRNDYLAQVFTDILPVFERASQEGIISSMSSIVAAQSLTGPMFFHWGTRAVMRDAGLPVPDREKVCAAFAASWCDGNLTGGAR